ncbi:MAG: DNA translocase FtsK [Bacteroidetes bacterium]|nr:MAG: DNA translocase FtsK [Bacteroidota bacterium]
MTLRTDKIKTNKLKDKPRSKKKSPKTKRVRKPSDKKSAKKTTDPRVRRTIGFALLVISMYLFLAVISFFISWFEADPGTANGFMEHTEIVQNWTGKFGVWVSGYLVQLTGLGSFLLPLLLFSLGLKMMARVRMFKLWHWFQIIVLGLLWLPMVMNKIFSVHPWDSLGGITGSQLNTWMTAYLGPVGLILLLILIPAIFILIDFKFSFGKLGMRKHKESDDNTDASENLKEDKYNTVEFAVSDEEEGITPEVENSTEDYKVEVDTGIENVSDALEPDKEKDDIELTIEKPVVEEKVKKIEAGAHLGLDTSFDPTLDLPDFKMPHLGLLNDYEDGNIEVDKEELEANKNKIVETLNHYSISITKIKATIGPTVTLYEIVPAPGVRISKIKNLEDDIALSLSAMGIRIIAPIPGKGTVGIEVPNRNPNIVSMRSILASERFQNCKYELPFGLGKTIANESFVADLTRLPHVLMAGATGQGKSVGLNAIIASLLYKKHPSELKFILVDPKKVELTLYSRIERHYLAKLPDSEEAIITDTRKVVRTLNSLGIEMDNRYELLKDAQVRNVKEYNTKFVARKLNPNHGHRYLPYFVLVIDEFADLIMTAGKEIEGPITRLAQLARAVGIHLIIATQRPSVNIITGTIKANFPARIAFRVISKIDSRTILDTGGADQLVGRGDMLLSTGSDLIRLQCAFIDTPEVEKITDYIGSQRAYPDAYHLPEYYDEEPDSKNDFDPNERDELFEDAARIIVQTQQGSTSLLQRKLKLGYNRAGRIIDQLEAAGIVGPFEGSKAREVRVANEMALEQFLKDLDMNDKI